MSSEPTNWTNWDPILDYFGPPHVRADDEHLLEVFLRLVREAEALDSLIPALKDRLAFKEKAQASILRDVIIRIAPGAKEAGRRGRRRKLSYSALLGLLGRAAERRDLAEAALHQAEDELSAARADLDDFCLEIVRRFLRPDLNVDVIETGGLRFVISNKSGEPEVFVVS